MRLFLAGPLPDAIKQELLDVRDRWLNGAVPAPQRGVSLTRAENLHLTLKFLGEVPEPGLPDLLLALRRRQAAGPITLQTAGIVCFPPRGRIRVVAAGLTGEIGRLQALYDQLEQCCADAGFARERRAFHPHVTVARSRVGLPADFRHGASQTQAGRPFRLEQVVLYQSHLQSGGAEYVPLATFPV